MKSLNNFKLSSRCYGIYPFFSFFIVLILLFTSCTSRPEPYSILEFIGAGSLNNCSKSFQLMMNKSYDTIPTAITGSRGDLFWFDEYFFVYNSESVQNRFLFKSIDSVLYINNKISSINIPGDDDMIPWFKDMNEMDFSALQFINFNSKIPETYLPYLTELARIKPDAGLSYSGNLGDMAELFKIFTPRVITGPTLLRSNYDQLSKLTNLEILMVSLYDSVITDPLPSMPELKQFFLTEIDEKVALTNDLFINNKQIERLIIQRSGSFDFSILKPLDNLKELVMSADSVINFDLINDHEKLEVLSVTGDKLIYSPDLIRLPFLRWMTISSNVTQEEFNSFIDAHPNLEIIELITNDSISSLQALSKLSKLYGLTVTDSVMDIESVKTLRKLKYLSLPADFLEDTINKAEIQKSLPDTRLTANEGFCLGSGWLLLLIPLVLMIRFFGRKERQKLNNRAKS